MMSVQLNLRVEEDLAAWATEYAEARGVTRTALLTQALVEFRELCERGVPDVIPSPPPMAARKPRGVGVCPENAGGHVWSNEDLATRPCVHCGTPGRGEGGFLERASAERVELFSRLRAPASVKGQTVQEKRDA